MKIYGQIQKDCQGIEPGTILTLEKCQQMLNKLRTVDNYPSMRNSWGPNWDLNNSNPCNEWTMKNMETNTTPHTERVDAENLYTENSVVVNGKGLMGRLTIRDEDATLKVDLAGISPEQLQIRRVENILRIRVLPKKDEPETVDYGFQPNIKQLSVILAEFDEITSTKLALGVLTIEINRGKEIEDIKVDVS